MKTYFKNTYLLAFAINALLFLPSCKKEFEGKIVKDNPAEIPVTYEGSISYGDVPYLAVPYNGGNGEVVIKMKVPASANLKIKEITKIVTGNGVTINDLKSKNGVYNSKPLAVNETSYTLNTSIGEYNTKVAGDHKIGNAPSKGSTYTARRFVFRIVMENDAVIIPVPLEIRVTY